VYTSWQGLLKTTVVVKQTKGTYGVISITALIFAGERLSVSSSAAYCIFLLSGTFPFNSTLIKILVS